MSLRQHYADQLKDVVVQDSYIDAVEITNVVFSLSNKVKKIHGNLVVGKLKFPHEWDGSGHSDDDFTHNNVEIKAKDLQLVHVQPLSSKK